MPELPVSVSKINKKKSYVQSVLFHKNYFSMTQALNWLKLHGFYGMESFIHYPDETKNYYRFRQFNPSKLGRYAIKNSKTDGVKFVIEY